MAETTRKKRRRKKDKGLTPIQVVQRDLLIFVGYYALKMNVPDIAMFFDLSREQIYNILNGEKIRSLDTKEFIEALKESSDEEV